MREKYTELFERLDARFQEKGFDTAIPENRAVVYDAIKAGYRLQGSSSEDLFTLGELYVNNGIEAVVRSASTEPKGFGRDPRKAGESYIPDVMLVNTGKAQQVNEVHVDREYILKLMRSAEKHGNHHAAALIEVLLELGGSERRIVSD